MNPACHARTAPRYGAFAVCLLGIFIPSANALSLGEADVRSFLGQPLDLRITLDNVGGEYVDAKCFFVSRRRGASQSALTPTAARYSLDERLNSKVLRIRSFETFDESPVQLEVRAGCAGQTLARRDYTLHLDAIAAAMPGKPLSGATPAPASVADVLVPPQTNKRADSTWAPALNVAKPDAPRSGAKPFSAGKPAKAPTHEAVTMPVTNQASTKVANSMPEPVAAAEAGEFRLRLSVSPLDLSRSRGVSEEMRRNLRNKQLALGADDQGALLALKNTIIQLESRLNEMQLRLAKHAQAVVPAPTAESAAHAPAIEKTADVPPPTAPQQTKEAFVGSAPPAEGLPVITMPDSVAPTIQPVAPHSQAPEILVAPPKILPPHVIPRDLWWTKSWAWLFAGFTLLLVGIFLWLRRRASEQSETEPDLEDDSNPFTDWANTPDPVLEAEAEPNAAQVEPPRDTRRIRPSPASSSELSSSDEHTLNPLHKEIPALLDLDTQPASLAGFPRARSNGDDRQRRLRYMEERFAEIANASITLDDSDSIIDAARLYYEERQVQKAIELLTYALEERPAQLRYWLALIDIYRLERMTTEFCILAAKFRDLHSGADVWTKVQHIGRDLDPSNPLFAAALGRLGLPDEREFDPMVENWLNAPMDLTSDVLMVELRSSLLDEHGVEPADLSGTNMGAA